MHTAAPARDYKTVIAVIDPAVPPATRDYRVMTSFPK